MTIGQKVKNLVNPTKWVQGFMISKFAKRMAQFGAAAAVGLLANEKLQSTMADWGFGMKLDKEVLANALAAALVALIGGLMNTAKHGPLKTVDDDPKGPPAE